VSWDKKNPASRVITDSKILKRSIAEPHPAKGRKNDTVPTPVLWMIKSEIQIYLYFDEAPALVAQHFPTELVGVLPVPKMSI
jgi:hypothetical protein